MKTAEITKTPVGVRDQVCVAGPPLALAAVTENWVVLRDCTCVGVYKIVLPDTEAPSGDCAREKLTALPSGDVAASW